MQHLVDDFNVDTDIEDEDMVNATTKQNASSESTIARAASQIAGTVGGLLGTAKSPADTNVLNQGSKPFHGR